MAFVNYSEDPMMDFWKIYFKYLGASDNLFNVRPVVNIAKYYPYNKSLQEEFVRLFSDDPNWNLVAMPFAHGELHPLARELPNNKLEKVWRDFRKNGVDVEDSPSTDPVASELPKQIDIAKPIPRKIGDATMYDPVQMYNTLLTNYNCDIMNPIIPTNGAAEATLNIPKMNFPFAMWCVFCRNNNAADLNSLTHTVKDLKGNVLCPVLRSYICPICFETGDNAHTLRYCPKKNYFRNLIVERKLKKEKRNEEAQKKNPSASQTDGEVETLEHDENKSQECDDENLQECDIVSFDVPVISPEVESACCPEPEINGAQSGEEEPPVKSTES